MLKFTRRVAVASIAVLGVAAAALPAAADGAKLTFTMATSGSETDARSPSFTCYCGRRWIKF